MLFDAFYSDPHFGHAKMAEMRGFDSADAMDDALARLYRLSVTADSTVLWCGDVQFFRGRARERTAALLASLPGRKVLLRGNHDWGKSLRWWASVGFDLVLDGEVHMEIAGCPVTACHLPYAGTAHAGRGRDDRYADRRPVRRKGEALIHGHTHSDRRRQDSQIHVGCDAWGLAPAPAREVAAMIAGLREVGRG